MWDHVLVIAEVPTIDSDSMLILSHSNSPSPSPALNLSRSGHGLVLKAGSQQHGYFVRSWRYLPYTLKQFPTVARNEPVKTSKSSTKVVVFTAKLHHGCTA